MPQIVFSDEEKAAIEAVVADFDPEYHQLTQGLRAILSEDDWRFVVESMRKNLRLQVAGAIARPVIEDAQAYYDSQHEDRDDAARFYKLGCSLEEIKPLEEEWNLTWGRSPLWRASHQLIDGAEDAVRERVAAA